MAVGVQHLIGREEELAALLDLLEAPAELPAIAAIVGDAGIGKTMLWLAAAEAAAAREYLVLSCRPSEAEAGFSFAGLADLVGGVLPGVLPELPRPQRRALEAALALSDADDASAEEGVVAFALLSVLRGLATGNRLLLAIDDVQWLDAPSLAMLRFVLPRLETEPVATILSARESLPSWLRRLPEERLRSIALGPLSVGALHELLRMRFGFPFPRPTVLRICETSGGNPFFALELASALQRRGGRVDPGEELPIPTTLDELVQGRLDRLRPEGLELARIVAALTNPTLGVVEAAAGRRAEAGLSGALEAGILELEGDRVRFTHPLLRSAVSLRSGPARKRSLHARLAALVADPEERARHLALATPKPSRDVAAALEEAATRASARGAAVAAAELAELAVRLTPPGQAEDMRRRVLECADRHTRAGDGRRAIALLQRALETAPSGPVRAAVLVHLAHVVTEVRSASEAVGLYREALAEAEGDAALEAEIHLRLADLLRFTDDRDDGLEHAEVAVRAASRAGDAALRCKALATFGLTQFRLGRGVPQEEMEEALRLERSLPDWPLGAPATQVLAHQLVWSGELERARPLLEGWREALRDREDRREAEALWYLSVLEWRAGNWELAARHAADSLALEAQFGIEGVRPIAEFPAALIAAHRGQVEDARQRSQRALAHAEAEGVRSTQLGHRWVLGFIELSCGDARAALAHLRVGWAIRDEAGIFEPGHRLELADTLEALVAVGELDEAEQRLHPWEQRSRVLDRPWALAITARCRALLLAARGDLASAQPCFERALAEHARTQDPFQHARTLLAFGATQRRVKQRAAARATLEHALALFERLGAPLWDEKARAELGRVGGRKPSGAVLTATEQRLAELVAEGYSNKEVAAALFVTPKTVGTQLSRIYAKLGVRSRTELARQLAERRASKV